MFKHYGDSNILTNQIAPKSETDNKFGKRGEFKVEEKNEYALEMKGISKSFPGVKALDCVSFNVKKGSVHALMGENGAGKSTLMKILAGIYKPDGGSYS